MKRKINYIFYVKLVVIIFIFYFLSFNKAFAGMFDSITDSPALSGPEYGFTGINSILIDAPKTDQSIYKLNTDENKGWWQSFLNLAKSKALSTASSKAFGEALKGALNTIAYDTATWIGSGGKGQKPLFIKEDWGTYLANVGDNAAGTFLEKLGSDNGYAKFNLCEPDLLVKVKIGLGLVQFQRPGAPACTFSQMVKNWDKELQREDFLTRFQDMFEPTSNDLGIALTLHTGIIEEKKIVENKEGMGLIANKGWLDLRNLAGESETPPGEAKSRLDQARNAYTQFLGTYTGDALVDAANIFLNQLAITAFNKFISGLGKDLSNSSSPYSGNYGLSDANAQRSLGASGLKEKLRKLTEPSFKTRGDYNILAELAMCPDPNKAGPTNCVITNKFKQGISEKKTVGMAMKEGYLNSAGIFGFTIGNNLEPSYNDGNYPYRSMIILRKYRILPVGWELAAQYIKEDSSVGTKNLGDLVACFDPNDEYDGYNANWCRGLVDPNWVLKAPLNYCKREGAGPEILNEQIVGSGSDSELSISRNENYCADEQSCIKENKDGSCQLYGYCTEERRKWDSGTDSCEPRNNTCQTFRGENGSTASYLENTLDYTGCSVDNAGCKAYSLTGAYATTTSSVQWSNVGLAYFDKDIKTCSKDGEGCRELIRINSGANLFVNPSFEKTLTGTFWEGLGTIDDDAFDGANSLAVGTGFSGNFMVGTGGYPVGGNSFAFSFFAKDCGFDGEIKLGNAATPLVTSDVWNRYSISYLFPASVIGNAVPISLSGASDTCKIDAVKLELGESASDYNDYRDSGIIYQKMLPGYLEDTCYENPGIDYALKDDAPSVCNDFSRQCNASEEGCEMFTSVSDGTNVPAKVVAQDYCPGECVGYDTYIQGESAFDSLRDSYFIPRTAKSCSAEVVGCDQFTNLDKVNKGGEGTEYYSYLRQCIKPDAGQCSDFYAWEGSDETGFQLKVVKLKKDGSENPAVSADDSLACNETIYHLSPTDPSYNPDCREFYNKNGTISYHLMSYTISCSDNCYPFRRTEINTDPQITDLPACGGTLCSNASSDGGNKCWDDKNDTDLTNDECIVCKNGGTWDSQARACIYMAIPEEGTQCAANNNGCREYGGNTGNNVRIVLNNDFEGSVQGWTGGSLSNEALMAGGNSLYISNASAVAADSRIASTTAGYLVSEGKSYSLTFLAKPGASNGFSEINSIDLINSAGDSATFVANLAKKSDGWQIYEVNLTGLDHTIDDAERLEIRANGNIFIDNLKLTEISDRYYLIKNSWNTPDSCDQDAYGNPAPLYMLGCDAYNDRDNRTHYLHSFSSLCQESAVGCELMIDTQNSNDYAADTTYSIPADKYIYAVYDRSKQCNANDKGCSLMGESYQYDGSTIFGEVYLKNNPDDYSKIMCSSGDVGCKEWTTSKGVSYFKDPGDEVCEWRQSEGEAGYDWYRKKIKRCDTNSDGTGEGNICLSDNNCFANQKCQMENNDTVCSTSNLKTFGYGGRSVYQPDAWAGLCSASEAGCTELIDPVSKSSNSLIFNADFSQDVDGTGGPDGWDVVGVNREQKIELEPNTLYVFAVEDNSATINSGNLRELDNSNNLGANTASVSISSGGNRVSKRFYTGNTTTSATIRVTGITGRVELKKAIVDYVLNDAFDKASCNGLVNFEDGCVLFNERSQNGSSLSNLKYDADLTVDDGSGISPETGTAGNRDANVVLKVAPDRVCDKWLACRSMAAVETNGKKENVCFDIGLCNSTDENGNCNGFAVTTGDPTEQTSTLSGSSEFSDASGYSKVGYSFVSEWGMKGDYKLGDMEQKGEIAKFSNSGFEFYGGNFYPVGWTAYNASSSPIGWESHMFKVVNNPISAQTEGIDYATEGKSFLKIGAGFKAMSESIEVINGQEYVLTVDINTKNMSGAAGITINGGSLVSEIKLAGGNSWTSKLTRFTANSSLLSISIQADAGSFGNFYVDNIQLRPALKVRTGWYTPQSCRLYPESDSLACEYYGDSGQYKKGWYGYCLEYDRYPGNPDACLMWWPVEKIKGDGVEEGAGYGDKFPLFYSLKGIAERKYEYRHAYYYGSGHWSGSCNGRCKPGYTNIQLACDEKNGGTDRSYCACLPDDSHPGGTVIYDGNEDNFGYRTNLRECGDGSWSEGAWDNNNLVSKKDGWYPYNGNLETFTNSININSGNNRYATYLCPSGAPSCSLTQELVRTNIYASKVVQTVTAIGQNKYWSGRVFEGSSYEIGGLDYSTDSKPFGAVYPPSQNPYDWDGIADNSKDVNTIGKQPLYENVSTGPRAGSIMGCTGLENPSDCNFVIDPSGPVPYKYYRKSTIPNPEEIVKRLFAKSYNAWGRSKTYSCQDGTDLGATVCKHDCPGGECIATSTASGAVCSASYEDCDMPLSPFMTCATTTTPGFDDFYYDGNPAKGVCCETGEGVCTTGTTIGLCSNNPSVTCSVSSGNMCPFSACDWSSSFNSYVPTGLASDLWNPPTTLCSGTRPGLDLASGADYCAILPEVTDIKVGGKSSGYNVNKNSFVNLVFNAKIDSQQLPLVMYAVDWGDNENTTVSGVEMRDRQSTDNPFSLYHLYDYWDLKAKDASGSSVITCSNDSGGNYCETTPRVKIRDNWGWCNGGTAINDCDQWTEFGGTVKVYEK